MALHVLGHVKANELDTERNRELSRDFGFTDTRRACEQETAHRLAFITEPRARHLDRIGQSFDGLVLTINHEFQVALEIAQHFLVVARDRLWRNTGYARHHIFDLLDIHGRVLIGDALHPHARTGFIDHVDGLVRQMPLVDMTSRELRCSLQSLIGVFDEMVFFETTPQTLQDFDRLGDAGLNDIDLLEATRERMVLLEDTAIFLIGC